MSERRSIPCPICKKPVYEGGEDFPFCSARCRLIDLGKWSSEEYRISEAVDISGELDDFEKENLPRPAGERKEERHGDE